MVVRGARGPARFIYRRLEDRVGVSAGRADGGSSTGTSASEECGADVEASAHAAGEVVTRSFARSPRRRLSTPSWLSRRASREPYSLPKNRGSPVRRVGVQRKVRRDVPMNDFASPSSLHGHAATCVAAARASSPRSRMVVACRAVRPEKQEASPAATVTRIHHRDGRRSSCGDRSRRRSGGIIHAPPRGGPAGGLGGRTGDERFGAVGMLRRVPFFPARDPPLRDRHAASAGRSTIEVRRLAERAVRADSRSHRSRCAKDIGSGLQVRSRIMSAPVGHVPQSAARHAGSVGSEMFPEL